MQQASTIPIDMQVRKSQLQYSVFICSATVFSIYICICLSWSFAAQSTLLLSYQACQLTYSHFSWADLILWSVNQYLCTYFHQ